MRSVDCDEMDDDDIQLGIDGLDCGNLGNTDVSRGDE